MTEKHQYRGVGKLTQVLRMQRRRNGSQTVGKWRTLTVYLDDKPEVK